MKKIKFQLNNGMKYSNSKVDDLNLMFSIKEIADLKSKLMNINVYNVNSDILMNDFFKEIEELKEYCDHLKEESNVFAKLNETNPLNFSS